MYGAGLEKCARQDVVGETAIWTRKRLEEKERVYVIMTRVETSYCCAPRMQSTLRSIHRLMIRVTNGAERRHGGMELICPSYRICVSQLRPRSTTHCRKIVNHFARSGFVGQEPLRVSPDRHRRSIGEVLPGGGLA